MQAELESQQSTTTELVAHAEKVYQQHFSPTCHYERCLFLSWYCALGNCKFCFRSTVKNNIESPQKAQRTLSSLVVEALLCRVFGWKIEFLTGGYGIYPPAKMLEIIELMSRAYGQKVWLNLGVISKKDLESYRPYIEGVTASLEVIEPELQKYIAPGKPITAYERMFSYAEGLQKAITIVIGLGEKKEDFTLLKEFIVRHNLNRITFYALKPVRGTMFEHSDGPLLEDYLWWIAQTRIAFPNLEIIAGTTPRRYQEVGELLRAGANSFTKFAATKVFGSKKAMVVEKEISKVGRELQGTLSSWPEVDWEKEVKGLHLDFQLEQDMRKKLHIYLKRMQDSAVSCDDCGDDD